MHEAYALTRRETLVIALQAAGAAVLSNFARGAGDSSKRTIPAVPGTLALEWRRGEKAGDEFRVIEETVEWKAAETAIIVCDMWTDMACRFAAKRVARMAPRMNEVLSLARDHGVAILHAPSGGM